MGEEAAEHTADVEVEEVELPRLEKRAHDIHATITTKPSYYFQEETQRNLGSNTENTDGAGFDSA